MLIDLAGVCSGLVSAGPAVVEQYAYEFLIALLVFLVVRGLHYAALLHWLAQTAEHS